MDFDTAVFLEVCGKLANDQNELHPNEVAFAFAIASLDVLSQVPVTQIVAGFDTLLTQATAVQHIAEAEGFTIWDHEL